VKLSKPQTRVLRALFDSPPLLVTGRRPFTLQTCEALERRGLVELRAEDVGRPLVDITPAGMQFLDAVSESGAQREPAPGQDPAR
jgi:hypothetical protein